MAVIKIAMVGSCKSRIKVLFRKYGKKEEKRLGVCSKIYKFDLLGQIERTFKVENFFEFTTSRCCFPRIEIQKDFKN